MKQYTTKPSTTQGFALVIALSLMAFVLLLLVSISTLVKVESSSADTQKSMLSARQNALLALNVALGELQSATGPDQSVTARADIYDSTPATLADDGVQNPFWLAAYKTVDSTDVRQPLEQLRTWATDTSATDRVDWLVSSRTPLDGSVNPVTTDVNTLNGGANNVVTLATYNNNEDIETEVRVGKVDILDTATTAAGRFAWWVADESAKFKINAVKEDTVLNGQSFEPEWSLMAPQQSNPSIISDLNSFDVDDTTQRDKLERSVSASSLPLIDTTWETWAKENGNDFTFASQSIPVDVTQGRLKEDLSVYLNSNNSGLSDDDNIIRGSNTDQANHYEGRLSSLSTVLDYDADNLPKFGLIKSWYQTGSNISGFAGGTPEAPRPHTDEEHGLHPVLLRGSVNVGLAFRVAGTGFRPAFLLYPKFVLWNPHNVPIAPSKYVVQVRCDVNTLITDIAANGRLYAAYNESKDFYYEGHFRHPNRSIGSYSKFQWTRSLLERNTDSNYQINGDDEYTYLTFVINNDGFAPGESLYYTAADKADENDFSKNEYVNEDITYIESNFSDADFEDHNLLINEEEGVLGYFHITSTSGRANLPEVTTPAPVTPRTTSVDDILRAGVNIELDRGSARNLSAPDLSISTKLYAVSDTGNIELLQFLDFHDEAGIDDQHAIDWEHRSREGSANNVRTAPYEFQSLESIITGTGTPDYIRGHGFYITPTDVDPIETADLSVNYSSKRLFARNNITAQTISLKDPLVSTPETSALFSETKHTRDEFDPGVGFPSGVPDLDGEYDNTGADGYDTPGGYGLHATTFADVTPGNTVYPLYDYPRAETGLLSLGFLKNVNFSQFYWQPSFAFGSSEAHTHVARDQIQENHSGTTYFDLSYLLNESLWDRFFVSSIPQTGGSLDSDTILPNGRNKLVPNPDGTFPSDANLRNTNTAFEEVAANVMVNGAFNVNSTSVDAWRMFLASHLGESVQTASNADSNPSDNAPITSRAFPILPENSAIDTAAPQTWSALRSLSEDEINELAEAIVEEVKLRGPFLSMADFVNRRLIPDATSADQDYLGLKGALQASIDKVSTSSSGSFINDEFYQGNAEVTASTAPSNTQYPEHERGMPGNQSGSTMFGVPGFLSQADILAGLGSLMTVRGDTFTIRTYGESLSGITGAVQSKVWCEAVVQRIATPVEPGDSIVSPTGEFGRQYKLVSVRWLNESEVL